MSDVVTGGSAPSENVGAQAIEPAFDVSTIRRKVKVNGQEREVSLADMERDYQLKEHSYAKLQEAATLSKQYGPIKDALEQGDLKKLFQLLPNEKRSAVRKFSEEYLADQLEWEGLPESEQRRIIAEQKLHEYEAKEAERAEDAKKADFERERDKAFKEVDTEIMQSIRELGRNPDPYVVLRIVDDMLSSLETGKEPLSPKRATKMAFDKYDEFFDQRLKSSSADELLKKLSPEQQSAIRKLFVEQVTTIPKRTTNPGVKTQSEPVRRMSIDDAFAQLEKDYKIPSRRK